MHLTALKHLCVIGNYDVKPLADPLAIFKDPSQCTICRMATDLSMMLVKIQIQFQTFNVQYMIVPF